MISSWCVSFAIISNEFDHTEITFSTTYPEFALKGTVGRTTEFKLHLTSDIPINLNDPSISPSDTELFLNKTATTCKHSVDTKGCDYVYDYIPAQPTGTKPTQETVTVTAPDLPGVEAKAVVNLTAAKKPVLSVDFRVYQASDNDMVQINVLSSATTTTTPQRTVITTQDHKQAHIMQANALCPLTGSNDFLAFNIGAYSWQGAYAADKPGKSYVNSCNLVFSCADDKLSINQTDTTCIASQQYYYDTSSQLLYILN